jgi:DNA-binding winged helix-turn-helix (wHTH) protein
MASRLRFGAFELDLTAYTLRSGGDRVPLERQAMELLRLLVEARGGLVDRAQIQAALWKTDVFVDHEAAINTAVRKLRRALGDRPERPQFIETVVGKGYRFVAAVREERPSPVPPSHDAQRRFPKYRIRRGDEEYALAEGANVIGREPDAHVYIDHPSVSRRHALISIGRNGAAIEDLGSRNGTYVDGRRIDRRAELHPRAVIGAGAITMTFEVLSAPASTKPMRSGQRLPS